MSDPRYFDRPNMIITPFEAVEIDPSALDDIHELSGSYYDRRTRKGKAFRKLEDAREKIVSDLNGL